MMRLRYLLPGLGAVIVLVFAAGALLAHWLAPYDPAAINLSQQLAPPSAQHLLGQDVNGADIFSRLLYGARISLLVGLAVILTSAAVGTGVGLLSGYYGGWLDVLIMRLVDILLAFPGLLLAIALVAVLGPSVGNVILAMRRIAPELGLVGNVG